MTVASDINFSQGENVEDRLLVTPAFNISEGAFMSKTSMLDMAHNRGNIINHPTISGLIRSSETHLMTKGRIRVVHTLNDDMTPEQIQNYLDYARADAPNVTAIHEPKSNSIHLFYTTSYTQDSFRELVFKYAPLSNESKMTFSEGSDLICFLRIDDDPEAWTVEYRDITDTATIDKQSDLCYLIFSTAVTVNGNSLTAGKAYKMTSDSLDVTVSENTKVIRMHRAL